MNLTFTRGITIHGDIAFSSACFSENGKALITTVNGQSQSWDTLTGQALSTHALPCAKNESTTIARRRVGRESSDPGYRLIDTADDAEVAFVHEPFPDYSGATVSPNGEYVAIGYQHGRLRLEQIPTDAPMFLNGHSTSTNNHLHQNSIHYLEFDSSSRFLVSMADEDGSPRLWDLHARWHSVTWNRKPAYQLNESVALNEVTDGGIDSIRFSPMEACFVSTHRHTKTAQVWEIQSGSASIKDAPNICG